MESIVFEINALARLKKKILRKEPVIGGALYSVALRRSSANIISLILSCGHQIGQVLSPLKDHLHAEFIFVLHIIDLEQWNADEHVDSSEVAFKVAGSMAFKGGAQKADPVLLEPIMSIEIVTPEEYMGDVVGDLSRRRGVIHGMEDGPSGKVVSGEVPLAEMFGYATDIRSASQGRATFTMEPLKYSEVPSNVAEAIINKND